MNMCTGQFQLIIAAVIVLFAFRPNALGASDSTTTNQTIAQIGQNTKLISTFRAKFKQIKTFRILKKQMILEGDIFINRAPFKLAWHIRHPILHSTLITDEQMLQYDSDSDHVKKYKYTDNPILSTIAKTYHDILLGDYSRLAAQCEISTEKDKNYIDFKPLAGSDMAQAVAKIRFLFNQDFTYLIGVVIEEPGGNSTKIDFSDIRINDVIPEKSWKIGNDC
jgi:outer membrane lipoprotein-sorting protein